MTISRMGSAALLVVLAAGCGLVPGLGGDPDLTGRDFVSTSVTVGGADFPLVDGTQIRLGFSDDTMMSANAGCNHFSARYRIEGGVLAITDGAMTEMACEQELAEQDEWLFAFLSSQPLISQEGDQLVLEDDGTVITLLDREVAEPDLPLVGPVWTVTALITGDSVASVPDGITATIVFTDDGLVMVNTGCNSGSGAADIREVTIRFGDLALTRMACEGAAAQMEAAMLRILTADVVRYTVDASALELSIAGYGLQLSGSALL
jgi:heat shock protein HslJ